MTWAHYRVLSFVEDKELRQNLEREAVRNAWTSRQLEEDENLPEAVALLKEKLRLRGLDCPELDTPEGQAAKRFVEALVNRSAAVTITTTKPDKWDPYLSDVFLETNSGEEIFLNNRLRANFIADFAEIQSFTTPNRATEAPKLAVRQGWPITGTDPLLARSRSGL